MAKICIAYHSRTGNTQRVAQAAAEVLGAALFRIQRVPLTSGKNPEAGIIGLFASGRAAIYEETPEILPFDKGRLRDYDLVIVAGPVWAGKPSTSVRSFLKEHYREIRCLAVIITHRDKHLDHVEVVREIERLACRGSEAHLSLVGRAKDGPQRAADFARRFLPLTQTT